MVKNSLKKVGVWLLTHSRAENILNATASI
jgi:hypothetical protein